MHTFRTRLLLLAPLTLNLLLKIRRSLVATKKAPIAAQGRLSAIRLYLSGNLFNFLCLVVSVT
jgi:hypothetical protein